MHKYLLMLMIFVPVYAHAQQADSSIFRYPIQMDTIVVRAARNGWDINAFIRRVRNDTTFYKAFRNMRFVPYTQVNDIRVYGKDSSVKASLYSHTRQIITGNCRHTETVDEKTTGDFYNSRHQYNYYTAELYAYLFFTKDTVCGESRTIAGALQERGKGSKEKAKWQLKQLIFNPGAKISGIPFMGDNASIFDTHIAPEYDFKLLSEDYNGIPCYVFKAVPKKEYERDVVFNELNTWFRKSDYSIVARDYSLSYHTLLYDFDVHMKVRTREIGVNLFPVTIAYDGNWHVFSKKRERVKFNTSIQYEK